MPQPTTRSRGDLKTFFVKNAIPTESNFADLIDGMLNQLDDGIAKLPNDALMITAAGDATSQKKAIHFYAATGDADPSWTLSLNPRQTPADAATAKLGFSISDGAGNSRLFVERTTGEIGIGTVTPQKKLHVQGASSGPFINDSNDRPAIVVTGFYPELALFSNVNNINHGPAIRLGSYTDASATTFKHWVIGTAGRNATFLDIGCSDHSDPNPHAGIRNYNGRTILTLIDSGSVGIGTTAPQKKLHVQGASSGPVINDTNDRPAIVVTGFYPELALFSNVDNINHGPAIRLGSYTDANATAFKHWVIGTAGRNAAFLDIGCSDRNDPNPHAGIRNYNGRTVLTLTESGRLGIGTTDPVSDLTIRRDATAALGPVITLYNMAGAAGAGAAIDFNGYNVGTTLPTLRLQSLDDGNYSSALSILSKTPGGPGNPLVERVRVTNSGTVFSGSVTAANSDLYFTNTQHNHSGIGNAAGFAAIENAKDYDCLMILGRAGTDAGRKVRLWDYLKVEGTLANLSDATTKRDIADLAYGLAEVKRLRPIAFNWIDRPNPHKSLGLIGQEVQPVIHEVVYDDDGDVAISYIGLIPVLVNAIKDLDSKLEALAAQKASR